MDLTLLSLSIIKVSNSKKKKKRKIRFGCLESEKNGLQFGHINSRGRCIVCEKEKRLQFHPLSGSVTITAEVEHSVEAVVYVEVLLYVHRNRRLIRDGSPVPPLRLSHSS